MEFSLTRSPDSFVGLSLQMPKMFLRQVYQLFMDHVSRAHDHHVFAEVVGAMEIHNHIAINFPDVFLHSENGQSHHMLSVDVVVNELHQCFFVVLVSVFQFLPDGFFFRLNGIMVY